MRKINYIVVHCSATIEGEDFGVEDFRAWHKRKGWSDIGYHYAVRIDGTREIGRPEEKVGAHVYGYNSDSIGVVYTGGLDANKKPKDTRTPEQKEELLALLSELMDRYPEAVIKGHRDFSEDIDGDGVIERFEWMKSCPCFNAFEEYYDISGPGPLPFENRKDGNIFRNWVNDMYPDIAAGIDLDRSGSHDNAYIEKAWKVLGKRYQKGMYV